MINLETSVQVAAIQKDIQEVIDAMEDKRLAVLCDFLKEEENRQNN